MSEQQKHDIGFYLANLSSERLDNAVMYLKFLYEQEYELDDFDYYLAHLADLDDEDEETVSMDEILKKAA